MNDVIKINRVVAEFCHDIANNPLSFFSESDLQTTLSARLREVFPDQYCTSVKCGPKKNERSTKKYCTGLVHNEYGAEEGQRMDIVVLGKDDVNRIDDRHLKSKGKYLKPRFGFELGTESITDVACHLAQDIMKLRRQVSERGFIIHFCRDPTLADSGTKARKRKDASIRDRFRIHFVNARPDDNLVVLAFVLRLGRMNKKIRGKCNLLNTGTGKWKSVNLRAVGRAVQELLTSPAQTERISEP